MFELAMHKFLNYTTLLVYLQDFQIPCKVKQYTTRQRTNEDDMTNHSR